MRIELNLASRPSQHLRRFYLLAGAALAILVVVAAIQSTLFLRDWWSGRNLAKQVDRLSDEVARLQADETRLDQQLNRPEARDVIDRAGFLNFLILQKSVSWTQIFMDLEKLVPNRVQVASIRPEVLTSNRVRLDMSISGEGHGQLVEFVRRVETSDKFGEPVLSAETPPAQGAQDTGNRLTLTVLYAQK